MHFIKQVPFSKAIGNRELTHARVLQIQEDKETEEGKRGVNIWKEVQRVRKKKKFRRPQQITT